MSKKHEPDRNEDVVQDDSAPASAQKDKKVFLTPKRLETIVAVLLGVTTLLSAWAAWIAHLHGGLQSINFTESNLLYQATLNATSKVLGQSLLDFI